MRNNRPELRETAGGPGIETSDSACRHHGRHRGPDLQPWAHPGAGRPRFPSLAQRVSSHAPSSLRGAIRIDQLGYLAGERKVGYLLSTAAIDGALFQVRNGDGDVVLRGRVGRSQGQWNGRYRAVQELNFSALDQPGTYRLTVTPPAGGDLATLPHPLGACPLPAPGCRRGGVLPGTARRGAGDPRRAQPPARSPA